jgi:acetyl esterase/lipase
MCAPLFACECGKVQYRPSQIGVAGASAGGHLAVLVAMAHEDAGFEGSGGWVGTSSRVQAVSSWYGPSDFTVGEKEFEHHADGAVIKLFRGTLSEKPEEYRQGSPITYVASTRQAKRRNCL